FKSTDGGLTWFAADGGLSGDAKNVYALAIDPNLPTTIYMGGPGIGVWKSVDGAGTWRPARKGIENEYVRAFAVEPQAPTTLYVATHNGIFKSVDAGGTWQKLTSGLPSDSGGEAIAVDPAIRSVLYAEAFPRGVYKTTDAGGTWRLASSGLVATNSEAVVVDPRRSTTVYAGSLGAGVYKSTDGANTWRLVGEKPYFPQALAIDPLRPTLVWASSYPGLFKSAN